MDIFDARDAMEIALNLEGTGRIVRLFDAADYVVWNRLDMDKHDNNPENGQEFSERFDFRYLRYDRANDVISVTEDGVRWALDWCRKMNAPGFTVSATRSRCKTRFSYSRIHAKTVPYRQVCSAPFKVQFCIGGLRKVVN